MKLSLFYRPDHDCFKVLLTPTQCYVVKAVVLKIFSF